MAAVASRGEAARGTKRNHVPFLVLMSNGPESRGRRSLALWCHIGGGDDGAPVITIGFPEDF